VALLAFEAFREVNGEKRNKASITSDNCKDLRYRIITFTTILAKSGALCFTNLKLQGSLPVVHQNPVM
jgi:hypothetical protein